jgi:hypothetical protein
MVSPANPITSETTRTELQSDRGLIAEISPAYTGAISPAWPAGTASNFWGAVIGGSLVALSLFVLSWYLMLGCQVGVTTDGMIALGTGAAVWIVVTSVIAFFIAGWASNLIWPMSSGGAKGITMWSLTVLLAVCFRGWIGAVGPILYHGSAGNLPMAAAPSGYEWTAFLTLFLGLGAAWLATLPAVGYTGRRTVTTPDTR